MSRRVVVLSLNLTFYQSKVHFPTCLKMINEYNKKVSGFSFKTHQVKCQSIRKERELNNTLVNLLFLIRPRKIPE